MMSIVWDDETTTSQSERLVLLSLADHTNDDGTCWPSISRIAKKSLLSERSLYRVLSSLKKQGKLEIVSGGGKHRTNTYRITLTPCQGNGHSQTLTKSLQTLSPVTVNPDKLCHPNHQEPSIEPSVHADAEFPTFKEVKEFAACNGVLFDSAKSFFEYHDGKNLWLNKHGRLINWRKEIVYWAERDRQMQPKNTNPTNYFS